MMAEITGNGWVLTGLVAWYRRELRTVASPLIAKWAKLMKLPVPDWRINHMKTKSGPCSIKGKRIWLNLELVKKNRHCLEYIIVHEMAHFQERHHNERFVKLFTCHNGGRIVMN